MSRADSTETNRPFPPPSLGKVGWENRLELTAGGNHWEEEWKTSR